MPYALGSSWDATHSVNFSILWGIESSFSVTLDHTHTVVPLHGEGTQVVTLKVGNTLLLSLSPPVVVLLFVVVQLLLLLLSLVHVWSLYVATQFAIVTVIYLPCSSVQGHLPNAGGPRTVAHRQTGTQTLAVCVCVWLAVCTLLHNYNLIT